MVFVERGVERFDPTTQQPRDFDQPARLRRPGGLGVHLVKTYMDEFNYEHVDGQSTITVSKRLDPDRV
jgi:anti-sigma regulatory factor (Ser/Thr protein kinase)